MSECEHPVILLAEDNDDDVAMLRRAFLRAGINLPLQVVPNGEEAIAYLTGEGRFANRAEYPLPDLFLLDLKMPGMDGFDVLAWLRQHPTLAPLRTVVLTTSDEIRDVNQAYVLGANSFLTKPVDVTDFKSTLQEMFNFFLFKAKRPEIRRPPLSKRPKVS
jgi:CheY-like chemotaxis protein